jgi:hypothetical protein
MTANKTSIITEVVDNITKKYQIDAEVIEDFRSLLTNVLAPYYLYNNDPTVGAKKGKKASKAEPKEPKDPKKVSKPRKTSAYNVYVKEMMQTDGIKAVPQKEKMSKIGQEWKTLSDAAKGTYKTLAEAQNAANPAFAVTAPAAAQV